MIISAIISTKRIERFLSQVEISKEFEGIRNMARVLCKSNTSLDEEQSTTPPQSTANPYEDSYNNNQIKSNEITIPEQLNDKKSLSDDIIINGHDVDENESPNQDNSCSISKNNGVEKLDSDYCSINDSSLTTTNATNNTTTSDCDDKVILRNKNNNIKLKKQNQLSESTKLERNLGRTIIVGKHSNSINNINSINNESLKRKFKISDDYIVSIKDAKYSWDNRMNDSNMLKIDQLSIPRGTIYI